MAIQRLKKKTPTRAFHKVYALYQDRVYRTCLRILAEPHEAEDAAQEAFITVYRHWDKFRGESRLYTWIYKIALCTALRRLERKKKLPPIIPLSKLSFFLTPLTLSTDEIVDRKELAALIQRNIEQLSPKLKVCLILRVVEELSYMEIARILRVSPGTVKSRLKRARENIQKFVQNKGT